MTRKFLILPLAIGAVAIGSGTAQAQTIVLGDTSQTSSQSSTTNQSIDQSSGGGAIVIGGGDQNAQNNSNTNLNNLQETGGRCDGNGNPCDGNGNPCTWCGAGGGINLGDTSQSNTQSSTTNQDIDQDGGGAIVIFGLCGCIGDPDHGGDQNAQNNSNTNLNSTQRASGLLVLGDTTQANAQAATTDQDIDQDAGGATLIIGGGDQNSQNNQNTNANNCQEIGFGFFCV
ncbi:MAG: hypothetical protein LC777_12570 [Actinobacteria bacterium]|nr:hypothetical protein [Actinomycetota bacterium]